MTFYREKQHEYYLLNIIKFSPDRARIISLQTIDIFEIIKYNIICVVPCFAIYIYDKINIYYMIFIILYIAQHSTAYVINRRIKMKKKLSLIDGKLQYSEFLDINEFKNLNKHINWDIIKVVLESHLKEAGYTNDKSFPYDAILMFKIIILRQLLGVSPEHKTEVLLKAHPEWSSFLGCTENDIPQDGWLFKFNQAVGHTIDTLINLYHVMFPSEEIAVVEELQSPLDEQQEDLLNMLAERYKIFIRAKTGASKPRHARDAEEFENLKGLEKCIPANPVETLNDISLDMIKVWLLLLQKDYEGNIPKIATFLEAMKYGWGKDIVNNRLEYKSSNSCNSERCCRRHSFSNLPDNMKIETLEQAKSVFEKLESIFFDKEHGQLFLYVFNYCIAGLFKSKLTRSVSPLYLQISCNKGSALHELISEIITICDVNAGFFEECRNQNGKWACNYDRHKTIFPIDVVSGVRDLSSFKDTPVVIDGYGSDSRSYHALLKEVANKANRNNDFELDNVLPVFLCSQIKVSSPNIFNMDLSGEEVQVRIVLAQKKLLLL